MGDPLVIAGEAFSTWVTRWLSFGFVPDVSPNRFIFRFREFFDFSTSVLQATKKGSVGTLFCHLRKHLRFCCDVLP
jgi:hypothetical protein